MARSTISLKVPYIKTLHKKPYPAISPLRPELSQAGRTVLVVGGSTGIGFAITKAFVQATASHVIITGRRQSALDNAVTQLKAEASNGTAISSIVSDMSDLQATAKLWSGFKRDGIVIDVLVLNAMSLGEQGQILGVGLEATWKSFETNVRGLLDFTQHFHQQDREKQKYLVNVSTSGINNFYTEAATHPIYGLTKNSGTLLMQLIAKDTDPKDMQIISMHPGGVLSESARSVGYTEATMDWDDENLAGQFAVWSATQEAQFLHGRFAAVWWDVDEMKGEFRERIASDIHFMGIGLVGLE